MVVPEESEMSEYYWLPSTLAIVFSASSATVAHPELVASRLSQSSLTCATCSVDADVRR